MSPEATPPILIAVTLAFFRVGGLIAIAPLFSSRAIPTMVRGGLAILLTVLLVPALPPVPVGMVVGPSQLAAEFIIGLGIGFGAAAMIGGAELAGDVLAVQTGLSGATALNPLTGQGTGVLGQLLGLFVLLLMLATGGHLVLLEALASSYSIVPVGRGFDLTGGVMELARTMGLLFSQGLVFASPIIAAVSVGYVALGVLARTSPQLNMLAVAFPLQIGLGLLVLGGSLPLAASFYAAWPEHVRVLSGRFLVSLLGG